MVPSLVIEDHDSYGTFVGAELNNLRLSYLEQEIIPSLEKALDGSMQEYEFGYEVYSFVCDKESCKIIDDYEKGALQSILPTKEIYTMLKEWTAFSRNWRDQEGLPAD